MSKLLMIGCSSGMFVLVLLVGTVCVCVIGGMLMSSTCVICSRDASKEVTSRSHVGVGSM